MSNKPPIEVPQGAIRLNTDSQRLEFFAQDRWYEMATYEEATGLGGRGFRCAGSGSGGNNVIETFNIATQGNSIDVGFDLHQATQQSGGGSSRTRAVLGGGYTGGGYGQTYIQYFEMNALTNSIDFGDLTVQMGRNGGASNNTRALFMGQLSNEGNVINFVTIASTGDALDFGDMSMNYEGPQALSNRTRLVFGGGTGPSPYPNLNNMDYVTIASTGNGNDFGDLIVAAYAKMAFSNSTRGIYLGGNSGGSNTNTIEFINIASTGNAQDFGDISGTPAQMGGTVSNATRGVFYGGYFVGSPNSNNTMEFITITSKGNSMSFGDLASEGGNGIIGVCDSHGGVC